MKPSIANYRDRNRDYRDIKPAYIPYFNKRKTRVYRCKCSWCYNSRAKGFWKGNVPVDAIEMTALNEAMYGYSDWEQGHPELYGYPDMPSCL